MADTSWIEYGALDWPGLSTDGVDALVACGPFRDLLAQPRAHPGEVWIVLACIAGAASAMRRFEARYLDPLGSLLRSRGLDSDAVSEVKQRVRIRLFLKERDGVPVILHCAGQGRLAGLMRVTAIREAARLRAVAQPVELDLQMFGWTEQPQKHLDSARRELAKLSFERAVAGLEPRDRVLLRLHYVKGLSAAQVARMYGVHRATGARWLENARSRLRRGLTRALRGTDQETELCTISAWSDLGSTLSMSRVLASAE